MTNLAVSNLAHHPNLAVGTDKFGQPFGIPLHAQTCLIAGRPGSGKSVALLGFLRVLATSHARIFLVDMKPYAPGLAPFEPRAERTISTQHAALQLFSDLLAENYNRFRLLRDHRLDKAPTVGELAAHFTPLVIVIDEAADLLAQGTQYDRPLQNALRRLMQRDRAVGLSVLLGMQRPSHDLLPTSVRDLFGWRVCFGHTEGAAGLVFGSDIPADVKPWDIPPTSTGQGVCFATSEKGGFTKARFTDMPMQVAWRVGKDTTVSYNNWLGGYKPSLESTVFQHPKGCPCRNCGATCACDECDSTNTNAKAETP